METILKKIERVTPELKKELGKKNNLAVPRLVKVIVSSGTGKAKDKNRNTMIADRLAKITGQKPTARAAKQSIASFKLREGDIVGQAATLRGQRMYLFLDKLINIAMPRTRDFKGFSEKSIDEMGNLTIGIKEHTIFPETSDEELKDVFGFSVTMVTTAKNHGEALTFFKAINFPFKKAAK